MMERQKSAARDKLICVQHRFPQAFIFSTIRRDVNGHVHARAKETNTLAYFGGFKKEIVRKCTCARTSNIFTAKKYNQDDHWQELFASISALTLHITSSTGTATHV